MIATLKNMRATRFRAHTTDAPVPLQSRLLPAPGRARDPREMCSSAFPRRSSARSGITLIEVLIAVFILTFGLMGIAMVIPAGRSLMIEAAKSDRGSACGRAVMADMQIRGWLNPGVWGQKWGPLGAPTTSAPVFGNILYGETYLLDPHFFVANRTTDSVRHFPYSGNPGLDIPTTRSWPDRALARRLAVTMPDLAQLSNFNFIPEATVDRITTWADELKFTLENDRRPRQLYTWTDGQNWAGPVLGGDDTTLDLDGSTPDDYAMLPTNEGRFRWAVMITPIVPWRGLSWDYDSDAGTPAIPMVSVGSITRYEISVVIFYNRSLTCPDAVTIRDAVDLKVDVEEIRERSVYAQIAGGGVGGGDVLLFVANKDNRPAGYLNVRKNQWIMLKGLDRAREVPLPANNAIVSTRPAVCKWYRVVGVDDVQTNMQIIDPSSGTIDFSSPTMLDGRGRYVTLAGPDWNVDTTVDSRDHPTNPAGISRFRFDTDIAEAAIVDDVVGVYTTTINVGDL